jgi:predicted regulator of Ras-like GTPase activity (Roadblock/LC7/MglB family)
MEQDHLSECFVTNASFFLLKSLLFNTSIRTALFVRFTMTLPQLFAHIDGIEAVLVLDKEGLPILKLPTTEAVDQLDLQSVVPSAQMLQDQSQRMNLKKLKTIVTYWSARQIITYNVPPLVFIVAADTNVNTGALLNLYNDFQLIASEEPMNKL